MTTSSAPLATRELALFGGATHPLTYGITPPKLSAPEERRREIAALQTTRIRALPVDALVIYDLQDESSRTDAKRPFPFLQAIDPADYAFDYLGGIALKKIVYRGVSTLDREKVRSFLTRVEGSDGAAVLVGAPSKSQSVRMRLSEAYEWHRTLTPNLPLGGVMIAERHERHGGEVERVFSKMDRGCTFFISQAAYSVTATKNLLSDLYYRCESEQRPVPTILVTLSPCGSTKTLEFLHWLGVAVPRWLENELRHARDILEASVDLTIEGFREIHAFASDKGIPLGCNVESVSLHRAEIEASVEMVSRASSILGRDGRSSA